MAVIRDSRFLAEHYTSVHRTVCTAVHCALRDVRHYTMRYSQFSTEHYTTVHCAVCTAVYCALCSVRQCTLYTRARRACCGLYTTHCTLCTTVHHCDVRRSAPQLCQSKPAPLPRPLPHFKGHSVFLAPIPAPVLPFSLPVWSDTKLTTLFKLHSK